jgi:hypothetical protein
MENVLITNAYVRKTSLIRIVVLSIVLTIVPEMENVIKAIASVFLDLMVMDVNL